MKEFNDLSLIKNSSSQAANSHMSNNHTGNLCKDNVIPFPQPQPKSNRVFDKQAIIDSLNSPYYLFDFNEWAELSDSDPELFEKRRKEVIDKQIERCEDRNLKRIQGIQWRIEQERRLSTSSMDSCLRVYNMMWDHFAGSEGLAECLKPFQYHVQKSLNKQWD